MFPAVDSLFELPLLNSGLIVLAVLISGISIARHGLRSIETKHRLSWGLVAICMALVFVDDSLDKDPFVQLALSVIALFGLLLISHYHRQTED